jgi:thiamine pyrophosphate-dependent acetolactate synthase large subunit-like protein
LKSTSAIAEILKREGVEYLFCFPVNPLIDAAAEAGIKPIMPCTERTLVGMADAFSRVNNGRRVGVCAVQQGPGVENAFGGIAQAFADSSPILCIPGGPALSRLGSPPNFDPVLSYQHIVKWASRFNKPERIPEFMRRAFTYLRTGRPGPVLLELPQDVAVSDIPESQFAYQPVKGPKTMANPEDVKSAVKALIGAKDPVIHAGIGVLYAEAWEELKEFAELLQVPVMTTLPGKSCFPEDHPLALGCGGLSGSLPVARFLAASDLLFAIGSSLSISPFAAPIPKGKNIVQLTVDERDLNKDYPAGLLLLGDARLVLRQMIEEGKGLLGPNGRRGEEPVAKKINAVKD